MKQLQETVLQCTKCNLRNTCNQVVFGDSNPKAKIMIIGEAPGAEEDKLGKPFVGRSGQLLNKILEACNLDRNKDVFISNIVKCRPPNNRIPTIEEINTCLPWLKKQIEIINPSIILLLGATALKVVLGEKYKITKDHGKWFKWEGINVIPTYHPSALLRNPSLKQSAWEDFQKIVKKVQEIHH